MRPVFQIIWNQSINRFLIIRDVIGIWLDKVLFSHIYPHVHVVSLKDTLERISSSHCSISRFGDGEIKLIAGKSLAFQPYSKKLGNRLKEVLSSNLSNHLVCLPDIFNDLSLFTSSAAGHWRKHLAYYRGVWVHSVNHRYSYGNAFVSRCFLMYKNKSLSKECFSLFKEIWRGKNILLLEGENSCLGVGNDLFDNVSSVKRIPTASVLAYDLAIKGYQALDIGHLDIEYEWYITGAKHPIPVPGKHVNEAGGAPKEKMIDEHYQREIICRFQP